MNTPSGVQSNFWRNLAIAALASHLLWVLYFLRRGNPQLRNTSATPKQPNADQQARALQKAAETGNPAAIQQAILNWLRARWPEIPVSGLEEANRELGFEELEKLQGLLDAALYATPPRPLNRQQMEMLVGRLLKRERSRELNREIDKPLPDLFA